MSSRSSSSSDILGPTGDSEYLLSSPTKPFSGRQMSMSPANFRLMQTPGSVKGKQRMSSPSKSGHSVRFDDVLLPVSSAVKNLTRGRQRSLSPTRDADGNSSPWRIRVTLEATQDEEDENLNMGSPRRNLLGPSTTMTTKVPLKDERDQTEPTPRRRRGRPRKTEIQTTPDTKIPTAPSPGNTPGAKGVSGQYKGRGRPRKTALVSDEPAPTPEPEPELEPEPQVDEQPTPAPELELEEPERPYSPLNLGGDGDSDDGDLPDGLYPADNRGGNDDARSPDAMDWSRSSPRVTFEPEPTTHTPDVSAVDRDYDDGNLHSTPSKMPSPTPDRSTSRTPANTLNAGHTPRPPPRLYPTPTSSSLVDEETQEPGSHQAPRSESHHTQGQTVDDPTNEHREFDSIIESEGFSMVSLDTLPSAKQHGLSTNSDRAKGVEGPLKPFFERESMGFTERVKRKASFLNDNHEEAPDNSPQSTKFPEGPPPKRQSRSPVHKRKTPKQPTPKGTNFTDNIPLSPPGNSPEPPEPPEPTPDRRKRPIAKLARIVRTGLALEGTLRQEHELGAWQDQDDDLETPKKRLENVFDDLDYDAQQELRAGLGLGQEIAKRKIQAETERVRGTERVRQMEAARIAAEQEARDDNEGQDEEAAEEEEKEEDGTSKTPQREQSRSLQDTPGTEMRRRMAEWQKERDAVSREIELANSSQVIVINSDENAQSPDRHENEVQEVQESEPEPEPDVHNPLVLGEAGEDEYSEEEEEEEEEVDEGHYENGGKEEVPEGVEEEVEEEEEEEDGGFDIWQQEAQEPSQLSQRSSTNHHHEDDTGSRQASSPSKNGSSEYGGYSPAPWTHERERVPYLGGRSRVRQLREQEVDFSTLGRGHTPSRSRYYYGTSSPRSAMSGKSSQRAQSTSQSPQQYADDNVQEQNPLSEFGLESSPHKPSDFQIDPTTRIEHERLQFDGEYDGQPEEEDVDYYLDAAVADDRNVDGQVDMTPQSSRNANHDVQGSTWFQRLTSLTPGWLKAPARKSPVKHSRVSEEPDDDDDGQRAATENENAYSNDIHPEQHANDDLEQAFRASRRFTEWRQHEPQSSPESRAAQRVESATSPLPVEDESPARTRPRPLTVEGYFTDAHYVLLRRLYRVAKQTPERFPYYPAPGRAQIIGDWIWTSDGKHGVPVTEGQFAVIDRFVRELATGDLQNGGTGHIGWTEADLHRRLISVIVGEQIRAERKASMRESQM